MSRQKAANSEAAEEIIDDASDNENPALTISSEDDGSFALLPGEYTYTATAEGYKSAQDIPFTVAEDMLTIDVALEAEEASSESEERVEETEAEEAEAPAEEHPPFDQSVAYNGVVITVKADAGTFPANASLSVSRVLLYEQRQADAAVAALRGENQSVAASYTVKLTQGINAGANDSYLVVSDDVTVTLDLNGQTIDRGLNNGTAQGFDNVITVYGKLTVQDTSTDQSGSITGGKNDGNGGGVRVESGTFTMEGGTIADNTAYRGSGVYVCSNSTFNMTGGTISDNEVRDSGGGVYVFGGAFTMSGSGGGVYVEANAFTMSGGTITGNTANRGGGVYVDDAATFAFSGAPVIDGNTWDGSAPDDVFLYRNSVITLSDALTCDPIGVTTQRKPGPEEGLVTITGGLREKGGDIGWFKSEDEGCALGWNDGGTEAVLGLKMAHSAAGHTGIYDGKAHGITVSVTAPGSGYTVRYGTTEGQYDLDESPIYTNAGDYTVYYRITAKGYFPVTGSAQVKITKATTTVVADAKTKVEGEADPALTYTVSGLVSGDALNGALSRAAGEAPGSYSITQGSLGSPNYALAFTGATLTITSKPPVAIKGDISFLPTAASVTKTSIGLSWTSFPGAEGYDIFFTPCGKKNAYQLIESVPADAQNSYTITGLKTGTPYKSYIMAWRMEGGAKTYIGKASPTVHAIAGMKNDAYCNAKSVAVRKKNLTVKVGKRKKITATVKGVKKGKKRLKVLKHVAKLRYYSSDCSIATVDSKGRVRGVGKGSCVIYVVANNGVHNEVNVTVK